VCPWVCMCNELGACLGASACEEHLKSSCEVHFNQMILVTMSVIILNREDISHKI
jgi:hypothetical protein